MKKNWMFTLILAALTTTAFAQNNEGRIAAKGFAVFEEKGHFQPYEFSRHAVGDNDIEIEILYAGICHSDLHHVFGDWGEEEFPMVPGHEIVGRVVAVGKDVTKFKAGDYAGVGCMINSCHQCEACKTDREQYCPDVVLTYHDHDQFHEGEVTQGGYSDKIVVSADYAITVPAGADITKVAPLLCAGITTWSPIMYAGVKKGDKVGVAGFGGLGHMGVQYAVSLGAEVTVFDITEEKREDALRMGAVRYVNVNNPEDLKGLDGTLDFILSTIPAKYEPVMYMKMLRLDGQFGIVGLPAFRNMPSLTVADLVFQGARRVFGSQIGGIRETQQMLDYSVAHHIYPQVEVIPADGAEIDKAYQNVLDGKVKFRYVIDMGTLK